jgi:photosystem II stability/assembly factor-like uncharacterized protein
MHLRLAFIHRFIRTFPLLLLAINLIMPEGLSLSAQTAEVIVDQPQLFPSSFNCATDAWYTIPSQVGGSAYLTLNVSNPGQSTNHGEWHPLIPQAGFYRVEAYITGHDPITWCVGGRLKEHDTTQAHYAIYHAGGTTNRTLSQTPLSNQWLNLGEYYFNAGDSGYVSLTDLNGEQAYTTTVSFGAMRFTYTRPSRPNIYLPLVGNTPPPEPALPNVGVLQGQGFDVCGLPSISKMQTWWNESPYSFYGLYLGGIQLPSGCAVANAAWVNAVHQQGWSFVPTWVGPQAPCSIWSKKMSSDPAVSYQQGRQEAEQASAKASSIGLTNNGLGGTIIYYDMEVFGGADAACRQAAASFMNGWVERLGELGNLAGGYGAHNSYVEDWVTIPHVPDDVWAASWYANTYDPYASVYNIAWLEGLWTQHQRIRQYAGDHHESWGGIGIAIDSDVADGMVALPPSGVLANPTIISGLSIQDSGWLSTQQGWLVADYRLYRTSDRGASWVDISPASVLLAYFLPSGQGWAVADGEQGTFELYATTDWGKNWDIQHIPLPGQDSWKIRQLEFTSPTQGWVVLQMQTSSAFDMGKLLKTTDGGLNWQTYDLPGSGKVDFSTPLDATLVSSQQGEIFKTLDGGVTWQSTKDGKPLSLAYLLPQATTLSGWLGETFGWAATSSGSCRGEKFSSAFTCSVESGLWQTQDSGQTWEAINLPGQIANRP